MNIKLISEEIELTSPDTVSSASLVRVYNSNAVGTDVLVTRRDDANTVIGSTTMPGGSIAVFQKLPTDTLEANTQVLATSIAYTN
jgi:hypothetical protein